MTKLVGLLILLSITFFGCSAEKQKLKDMAGNLLVPLSDIPNENCNGDSYFGLAYINGSLEKCDKYNELGKNATADLAYEQWKCQALRSPKHASIVDGKCQCGYVYAGPTCSTLLGCPEGQHKRHGVCSPMCHNSGTPAVGSKKIECICPVPFDGDFCERLACFRKSAPGQVNRFINSKTRHGECECRANFHGDNCEIIRHCENNGTLTGQKCQCPDGFGGEICEIRCRGGALTCSSYSTQFLLAMVALFSMLFWQ